MSLQHNRRHRLLIDLPVQIGIAVRLIALWAVMTLLTAFMAVLLAYFGNPTTSLLSHLAAPASWAPSVLAFAVMAPIAVLHLFRFSHRFAGPVFRLRSEMRRLAAGEPHTPLKFRDNDYWAEMADEFNAVAARLGDFDAAEQAGSVDPVSTDEPLSETVGAT